jgi:hypothetical protein
MRSTRYKTLKGKKNKTRKMFGGKSKSKTGKKWTTAIDAAQKTLTKTGSLQAAREKLKRQALTNARKLFGSVGTI